MSAEKKIEALDFLTKTKEAVDASVWHLVGGDRMKRVLFAETAIENLNNSIRALTAAEGVNPRIKPLVWNSSGDAWTPFGIGETGKDDDPNMSAYPIMAFLHGEHLGHFASEEEARQCVENEYEKAVLSTLIQEGE